MPPHHKVRKPPQTPRSRPVKATSQATPPLKDAPHLCRNMCFDLHANPTILDIFEAYSKHPRILQMNRDVTRGSLDSLGNHINEWLNSYDVNSLEGAPGYRMGALEPVLGHAIAKNKEVIIAYLMQRGVRLCDKALWKVIENNSSESVFQTFLDNGWDINKSLSPNRSPPLGLVLDKPNLLTWFLDHGADPNAESEYGVSSFMEAAAKAPLQTVQLLHQHGASPGNTAPCAARSTVPGRPEVLRFLLDIGASLDAVEFEHNTRGYDNTITIGSALNLACCWTAERSGSEGEEMVELLLERGARTDIKDMMGRTALELAKEWGTPRMVEMIQSSMDEKNLAEAGVETLEGE